MARPRTSRVPIPEAGGDEVGRLAKGFNRMLGALRLSQEQQHRLVQDAAHELRTPLTSVTANIDWLASAPDLDAETRRETLSGIGRELRELNDLMSEIIQVATHSRETPVMVETDLTAVVRDAAARFTRRTDRVLSVNASPVVVNGDADSSIERSRTCSATPTSTALRVLRRAGGGSCGSVRRRRRSRHRPEEAGLVFHRFYRSAQHRSRARFRASDCR
ncbi:MAG: HAMP domain-containing protein [Microthrixaceae bacterium]|nr:HAMP domain-containing protein [Microthrixaceae bacterium]